MEIPILKTESGTISDNMYEDWKDEFLKLFIDNGKQSDDASFSDDKTVFNFEYKICPYCGKSVFASDMRRYSSTGEICGECLGTLVFEKSAATELVNDCIYSLNCFLGIEPDKRIRVKARYPFFYFPRKVTSGFLDKPVNVTYKEKRKAAPDSLTINLGFPVDTLRREVLQVIISQELHEWENKNKPLELREGIIQWMTVHCLYLDFYQDYAIYCDEMWREKDTNPEYSNYCTKAGTPLKETLFSLEQLTETS